MGAFDVPDILDDLTDVIAPSPAEGDAIEQSSGDWVNLPQRYTHLQGSASAMWNVNHSLNQNPVNVIVVDGSGNVILGAITFLSANALQVVFTAAVAGKAFVSR